MVIFVRKLKILKINIDAKHERDKIESELGRDLTLRVAHSSRKTLSTGGLSAILLVK